MPSLLEMTDVPMINILEKCSYKSVLTLRKVCHSLRNFVDDSRFETDLTNIDITIDSTGFSVTFLDWDQTPDGFWTDEVSFAKNWTSNDLKIILKLVQNSKLSCLTVNTDTDNVRGLDDLEELLKNQTRPLQTEKFVMEGPEILKILPYLDPKTLKKISIEPAYYGTDDQNLDGIEKVMELEQFKNAVELTIDHFLAFVTSTHMEFFGLDNINLNEDQLEQVFGTPFRDDPYNLGSSQWFFGIRNCKEHVLRIEMSDNGILFWKWESNNVPKNAVVQR